MASTEQAPQTHPGVLQEMARRHLWMHFTRMSAYEQQDIPIIVRGEGCYVYDEHGKRYLDGLSSLFCVNIGHGRAGIAQAGADQARELGFFNNWSYAHPRAIELAARIASLAPGDRVVQDERLDSRRRDPQAEAAKLVVVEDVVAALWRLRRLDRPLGDVHWAASPVRLRRTWFSVSGPCPMRMSFGLF